MPVPPRFKLLVSDFLGGFLPVLLVRSMSALVLTGAVLLGRERSRCLYLRDLQVVCIMGIIGTPGNMGCNLGTQLGAVSVVSAILGIFTAVTVLLAPAVLKERLAAYQGMESIAILVGVTIIGYATKTPTATHVTDFGEFYV